MRTEKELIERMKDYKGQQYIYHDWGYIAWQVSTGENIEIIFIEVREKGKGHATKLLREMCQSIQPFHSVFVFRLASNESAGYFYRKMGFEEQYVYKLYKGCDGVLGVISYKDLCQNLSINQSSGKNELIPQ